MEACHSVGAVAIEVVEEDVMALTIIQGVATPIEVAVAATRTMVMEEVEEITTTPHYHLRDGYRLRQGWAASQMVPHLHHQDIANLHLLIQCHPHLGLMGLVTSSHRRAMEAEEMITEVTVEGEARVAMVEEDNMYINLRRQKVLYPVAFTSRSHRHDKACKSVK